MEQDDEEDEDSSVMTSVMKSLPSLPPMFIGKGSTTINGKVPPPPSEQNPYDLIETKKYLGSGGGIEGALPPPVPKDMPPSKVPLSLFEDSAKCTYVDRILSLLSSPLSPPPSSFCVEILSMCRSFSLTSLSLSPHFSSLSLPLCPITLYISLLISLFVYWCVFITKPSLSYI